MKQNRDFLFFLYFQIVSPSSNARLDQFRVVLHLLCLQKRQNQHETTCRVFSTAVSLRFQTICYQHAVMFMKMIRNAVWLWFVYNNNVLLRGDSFEQNYTKVVT